MRKKYYNYGETRTRRKFLWKHTTAWVQKSPSCREEETRWLEWAEVREERRPYWTNPWPYGPKEPFEILDGSGYWSVLEFL